MKQRVVVGIDGSIIAVRALDRAAEEAARRGAALEVVYAVPDLDEAGPILASSLSRLRERHPALEVTCEPVVAGPVEALLRRGRDAALTVVGTHGLGGLAGLLTGSASLRLAAHAEGPLLVVRGDRSPERDSLGFQEVLLGLESDADADAALYAFQEAARRKARLRIVHARTHRPLATAGAAAPGHVVAPLRVRYPQVEVETQAVRSGRAHSLVDATLGADVVVIAAHRRPGRMGPQLGPVTHALLHHSHCPVVVVPAGDASPGTPSQR
ncbi:universal stress protein [Streptomyces sp. NBC_01262]|uniref:universal stress protein n=1 Tax=Streptomyces sp. NBC_01262 TaxID=2903803 RepID=UPI002E2FE702|nr:universal stress protein [Streptomyces sp. NBC_01262]